MCLAEVVGRGLRPLAAASEAASRKLSFIPSERCPLYTTALIMVSLQTFPSETVSSAHYVCALWCLFSLYFGFFVQRCQQSVLCSFLSFTASADFLPSVLPTSFIPLCGFFLLNMDFQRLPSLNSNSPHLVFTPATECVVGSPVTMQEWVPPLHRPSCWAHLRGHWSSSFFESNNHLALAEQQKPKEYQEHYLLVASLTWCQELRLLLISAWKAGMSLIISVLWKQRLREVKYCQS